MVNLRTIWMASVVVVVAVVIVAVLPLTSFGDYQSRGVEVVCHFEAFVGQAEGEKGVYSATFTPYDFAGTSYLNYWSMWWSDVIDFATVDIPFPLVSLLLYEVEPKEGGGYKEVGEFPGIEKYSYYPYTIGERWELDIRIPVDNGDVIRWQIQIYSDYSISYGYLNGYWTVP